MTPRKPKARKAKPREPSKFQLLIRRASIAHRRENTRRLAMAYSDAHYVTGWLAGYAARERDEKKVRAASAGKGKSK